MRRTKILATVGPATSSPSALSRLAAAGVNAFRINFSHGSADEHRQVLARIHAIVDRRSDAIAIVADLQGPKIRVGEIRPSPRRLAEGERVVLDGRIAVGVTNRIPVAIPGLARAAEPGDPVLI